MAKKEQGKQEKPLGTGKVGDGSTGGWTGPTISQDLNPPIVTPQPKLESVQDSAAINRAVMPDDKGILDNIKAKEEKE